MQFYCIKRENETRALLKRGSLSSTVPSAMFNSNSICYNLLETMTLLIPFKNEVYYTMYNSTWNLEEYSTYDLRRSHPDNLVPLCKFRIIISIHFFRNSLFPQSMNTKIFA